MGDHVLFRVKNVLFHSVAIVRCSGSVLLFQKFNCEVTHVGINLNYEHLPLRCAWQPADGFNAFKAKVTSLCGVGNIRVKINADVNGHRYI